MFKQQLASLRYAVHRFFDLGGLRLAPIFLRTVRQQGFRFALQKGWRRFFWDQGVNYLDRAKNWYAQNHCQPIADGANQLFSRPHVLIVGSLDLPQCKKYRVLQKMELLEKCGCLTSTSDYRDIPRVFRKMQLATLVLFYRVPDGHLFRQYLDEAERLKIACGYDIDDPIFDSGVYAENPNLDTLPRREKNHLLASCSRYRAALEACQFISLSTPGLQSLVETSHEKPVILWRNVLDAESLAVISELEAGREDRPDDGENLLIAYMSGSLAHDADFETIAEPLDRILGRYPSVRLLVGGYARIPPALERHAEKITRAPFTGYTGYFSRLSEAGINLVPLVRDRFNDCKSAIRFLEAAALGVPTIASEVGDFSNLIASGENGLLAKTPSDWENGLITLIENPEIRRTMGINAKRYVMEQQTIDSLKDNLENTLTALLTAKAGER